MRYTMRQSLTIVAILALASAGCTVQTVHPIRTPETTIRDAGMEGVWDCRDDHPAFCSGCLQKAALTIKRVGGKRYRVSVADGNRIMTANAYLVDLQGHRFLEVEPESPESFMPPENLLNTNVPTRFFMRIIREGDKMWLGVPRLDEFKRIVQTNDDLQGLDHNGSFVITSSTEQLQHFLMNTDDSLYESNCTYLRSTKKSGLATAKEEGV